MTSPAHAIADSYVSARAAVDPEYAAAIGQAPRLQLPDFSLAAFQLRADAAGAALAALGGDDSPLGRALAERLRSDLELDEVGFTRRLLAPLATPMHALRQVFDDLPAEDGDLLREHLAAVPGGYADYRATLSEQAARGNVVARRQVLLAADQCQRWLDSGFFVGVLPGSGEGEAAAAGLADFARFLRQELAPLAGEVDGVGEQVYQVTSAAFLGERVDLAQVYEFGFDLIAQLQSRARALATQIVGSPDIDAATVHLDADTAGRIAVGNPLREWLQQRIDEAAVVVDERLVSIPAATRAVEAMMTTAAAGVMYYTPPDAGLTRPGRVWWTVPDGITEVATWREVSTLHHEGVPGHHLQHAVSHELRGLHPWQRYLCHVHGYAEGWAHYSEELAAEIGLLRTPGEELGMVLARLWRACRIVVDIGLHVGLPIPAGAPGPMASASRWTPQLGVAVLVELAGMDPQTARFEVDRYLGWPGQALAFAVGAKLWRQARQRAEQQPGYDLKEFHTRALQLGPMGLGPLREALS